MDKIEKNIILSSGDYDKEKEYWKKKLFNAPSGGTIPKDFPKDLARRMEEVKFIIPEEQCKKLHAICKGNYITLFVYLLTCYKILLYKYSNAENINVGTVVFTHLDDKELFNTVLPLIDKVNSVDSFKDLFTQVKNTVKEAVEFQNYPYEKMLEFLENEGLQLFESMFVLENIQSRRLALLNKPNILFSFSSQENTITGTCIFCTDLYKPCNIERMINHYINILSDALNRTQAQIHSIEMLSKDEKKTLLFELNATDKAYDLGKPIIRLFEEQVSRTPDLQAVYYENKSLTYRELDQKATYLGKILINKGVGKGTFVPIIMKRSMELVISILAVLKTGAAYVPIDPGWPVKRVEGILSELNCSVVLIEQQSSGETEFIINKLTVNADELGTSEEALTTDIGLEDPIYIIYTSGSTGKPKGVLIPNRGITNRFLWMNEQYHIGEQDVILQTTPHIYDSSIWQFFWPLINGGSTVIPSSDFEMTLDGILDIVQQYKITMTDFVPSIFNLLVTQLVEREDIFYKLESLRNIIVGGEEITPSTVKVFLTHFPSVRITNLYGPTETSIGVVFFEVTKDHTGIIPIGKPIANCKVLILDKDLNLLPMGHVGEIFITGACVGLGYFCDPEKTKESFIRNPFNEVGYNLMYRTGDLGQYLEDGNIKFCGRKDRQVKIRGHRIELSEIENILLKNEEIDECIVFLNEEVKSGGQAKHYGQICAYLVAKNQIPVIKLKDKLKESLPDYMIPASFIYVDHIPLMPSGKVDRKKLQEIGTHKQEKLKYKEPQNEIEQKLVGIWKEVLSEDIIGIEDNFFEIGGDSILVLKLHEKVNNAFQCNLKVANFFSHYTISMLSKLLTPEQDELLDKELLQLLKSVKEGEISVEKGIEQIKEMEDL